MSNAHKWSRRLDLTQLPSNTPYISMDPFRLDKQSLIQRFVADWALTGVFGIFFLLSEFMEPFHRKFSLSDVTIQYPSAKHTKVPTILCIILDTFLPATVIMVVSTVYPLRRRNRFRLIHISLLGLALTFVLNGFVTNCLKIWLGRPRPDFLDRCKPRADAPTTGLVGIEVCTNEEWWTMKEGFKSTPSGHSSTSFACLGYLSLWLCGQLGACRPWAEAYKGAVAFSPLFLALFVAASRTSDYRHHFSDVISGSILGFIIAWAVYRKYFPAVHSMEPQDPHPLSNESNQYASASYESDELEV